LSNAGVAGLAGLGADSHLRANLQIELSKLNDLQQQHQQAVQLLQQQQNSQLMQAIQLPGNVCVYVSNRHTQKHTHTHTHIVQLLQQQRKMRSSCWRLFFL
jgi:diadenosine tetraphosphate (Ap4A) HIT family hydrolase